MNITYRHMISALVLVLYLLIPAQSLVHAAAIGAETTTTQSEVSTSADSSCPACPCSDEQGSDCCDSTFCTCSFHTPTTEHLYQNYSPMVTINRLLDPHWSLPQVYGSIFVPPQNLA